jgi:hypothetical protein
MGVLAATLKLKGMGALCSRLKERRKSPVSFDTHQSSLRKLAFDYPHGLRILQPESEAPIPFALSGIMVLAATIIA